MAEPGRGQAPPGGPGLSDRPTIVAALAMAAVFVIVLAVALLIGRQNAQPPSAELATPGAGADATAQPPVPADPAQAATMTAGAAGPAGRATEGAASAPGGTLAPTQRSRRNAGPTATPAAGQPLAVPAGRQAPLETYRDPEGDFQVEIPRTWQAAVIDGSTAPWPAADQDVIWIQPDSGARLAVSMWQLGAQVPLPRAALEFAPGQAPVSANGPTNAMVAGVPALVLWAPESPVLPAVYTTLLQHEGAVYRVSYAANDGGAALVDYVRLLVSLEWTTPDGSAGDTLDTIPPLPQPTSRYFPSPEPSN